MRPSSERSKSSIDESASDDFELLAFFGAAFICAKEHFEPIVELTSDPLAWSTFRRHLLFAADPPLFPKERGLSLQRYTRLERTWARRGAHDEALAKTLRKAFDGPSCSALTVRRSSRSLPFRCRTTRVPFR